MRNLRLGLLAALALPVMAACTPTATQTAPTTSTAPKPAASAAATTPSGPAQQVTVKMLDSMRFDPAAITVKAGQPVEITAQNDGSIVHDFTLKQGAGAVFEVNAQPKNKATGTFTVATPGTYEFVCNEPGHEQAGMKGTLTVQ